MLYINKERGIIIDLTNGVINCIDPGASNDWEKKERFNYTGTLSDAWTPLTFKTYLDLIKNVV